MRKTRWLVLLGVVAACGLIAAGCGDDEESSSTEATITEETAEDASAEDLTLETTVSDETAEDESSDDSGGSGGVDAEGVYEACADAVSGTPSEDTALAACEQARDAFESCATQAESLDSPAREDAIQICSDAADQVISAAEAGSGG